MIADGMVVRVLQQVDRLVTLPFGVDVRVRHKRSRSDRVRVVERFLGRVRPDALPLGLLDDGNEEGLPGGERPIEEDRDVPGRGHDRPAMVEIVQLRIALHNAIDVRLERPEVEDVLDVVVHREVDIFRREGRVIVPLHILADPIGPVLTARVGTDRVRREVGNELAVLVEGEQVVVDGSIQEIRRIVQATERIEIVDGLQESDTKVGRDRRGGARDTIERGGDERPEARQDHCHDQTTDERNATRIRPNPSRPRRRALWAIDAPERLERCVK